MSDLEQGRSEQPTAYKLRKAREKGTLARGVDLGFLSVLASFGAFALFEGPTLAADIALASRHALVVAPNLLSNPDAVLEVTGAVLTSVMRPLVLLLAAIFLVVIAFEIVQSGGVVVSTEPLRPDFARMSPARGLKRVFSVRMLIETLKNVLKLGVYTALAVLVMRQALVAIAPSIGDAASLIEGLRGAGLRLVAFFAAAAAAFAILDQLIVRRAFLSRMMMSRREVRREMREREGEPRIKQRRRRLHREFAKRSRSLRNVRGADVVITNPVHLAVALRYDAKTMSAPHVVSQGAHAFADRLKALAFVYGVIIVENRELARALYYGCEIDQRVPEAHYRAVADIYLQLRRTREAKADV